MDAPSSYLGPTGALPAEAGAIFGVIGLLLAIAGLVLPRHPVAGRRLAILGLAGFGGAVLPALLRDPRLAIASLAGIAMVGAWSFGPLPHRRASGDGRAGALGASTAAAAAAWLIVVGERAATSPVAYALALAVFAVSSVHGARWAVRAARSDPPAGRRWYLLPLFGTALATALFTRPALSLTALGLQQALLLGLVARREPDALGWLVALAEHPARLMVSSFAFLGLGGGLVLSLHASAAPGQTISLLDGVFTAVSASCVTGLVVVDTPTAFSAFGQAVVLLLIQVGGLGIMTFSSAATLALGRRLGLRAEASIAGLLADAPRLALPAVLRRILGLTFALEGAGALALAALFASHGDTLGIALWRGVFTSVSAFCNAGFALQTDNLIPYQRDALLLHTVALLIIAGGLGTGVLAALPDLTRRRPVLLQVRLVVVTTAVLLVFPALFILSAEWSGALAGLPVADRLHNAWFQSVTLRTAGFNSIDIARTRAVTQTLMIVMMFVGGSPASTAGGIKTSTAAVLFLAAVAELRGLPAVTAFGRTIGAPTVQRAAALTALALATLVTVTVALQLTQAPDVVGLAFEAASALGTVGLSVGATARLDEVGKLVIILTMFLGRIGPLSVFVLLSSPRRGERWTLPEEPVTLG